MEIIDILKPEAVFAGLKANNKKHVLQELSRHASDVTGVDEHRIFETLMERERLGSTGVGSGIAVPHGKLRGIVAVHGVFAHLEKPINFASVDEHPVDLIFLLLAPEGAGADHLKALARVSRLLRDEAICKKLRGANTADGLYMLLTQSEAQAA